ncbi:MAG: hypothetical protein Ct9H90mP14_1200 [Methanobacteriota archaeon]|nr:MAG: hypothetical protein Ct9H90mP14_1200 [Euryarchaeota archaeon]
MPELGLYQCMRDVALLSYQMFSNRGYRAHYEWNGNFEPPRPSIAAKLNPGKYTCHANCRCYTVLIGLKMKWILSDSTRTSFGDVEGVDSGEMSASRLAIGGGIMALGFSKHIL